MKCIGIIAKHTDPRAESIVSDLARWLGERGREVAFDRETAALLGRSDGIVRSSLPEHSDFLVVIGGDGTLLSAARVGGGTGFYALGYRLLTLPSTLIGGAISQVFFRLAAAARNDGTLPRVVGGTGRPILGVNLGGLGFMTAVTLDELYPVLERILRGEAEYDERMMLCVHVHRLGERVADYTVLNDAVINKGALAKIVDIRVTVEREYLATYKSDGLIISSPTGSTGYSLSAHGPIVYPTLHTLLITPICPHMLTLRPLLVPDDMTVRAELISRGTDVFLTLDGQVGFGLREGDVVEVRKAKSTLRFIRSPFKDYFAVLRTKLKWGER
jgi:NAD+ kinase